jgi:HD-like signal output (HDOD) protein
MPTATPTIDPQTIVRDAIRGVTTLATLPEITTRIIATIEDPRSSVGKLHGIVSHDPALATRILKVVNSAFYGLPGKIASVERAISLLGLTAVKNVAVASSLGQMFRGAKLCNNFSARDLWTHCVAVGITARDIARRLGTQLADEAFLAGLIHDVGILVELQTWPERIRQVCTFVAAEGGDFCQAERAAMHVDHQLLGKALAEHWHFPKGCQNVAGFHHDPAGVTDDTRLLVTLVHVADTLCCRSNQGFNLTALNQELDNSALAEIGIDAAMLDAITTNLNSSVAEATSVFN